jgi:predicted P-loop ATPase
MINTSIYPISSNSEEIDQNPEQTLLLTCFTNTGGGSLSKQYDVIDGKISKTAAAQLFRGTAERMAMTLSELNDHLLEGNPSKALGFGVHDANRFGEVVGITTKKRVKANSSTIARSKDYFVYAMAPGVMMIDHDPSPFGQSLTAQQLLTVLVNIAPEIAHCGYIIKPSLSANVHLADQLPQANAGYHLYFGVMDASDIPRAATALFQRLWLEGYGFIALSKIGSMLVRSVIDPSVFAGERLDFTGRPILLSEQLAYTPPEIIQQPGALLDTRTIRDLSAAELATYKQMVEREKNRLLDDAALKRKKWVSSKVDEAIELGLDADEARAVYEQFAAGECYKLYGDFVLIFADYGPVNVAELFEDPERYDGKALADPIEGPDYGKTTAMFYWNEGKPPFINSHAHHGTQYQLYKQDIETLFERNKAGKILGSLLNISIALTEAEYCGIEIAYDEFTDQLLYKQSDGDVWQALTDNRLTQLRIELAKKGFMSISRQDMSDVAHHIGGLNKFDSAINWLNELVWDGQPRIERFLTVYFSTIDDDYCRAVALYFWTALAARILDPGCQADMLPILIGAQGSGKSTGVASLVPDPAYFCELDLADRDDNLSRKMRGRLIAELSELRGLRTKDSEAIKEFITRKHENWIPKYKEFGNTFARRLLFVGTTNEEQFLADATGNRRYLPVTVGTVDRDGILRDRDQLWAEAAVLYRQQGIQYQQAERLARQQHADYEIKDAWEEAIRDWIEPRSSRMLFSGVTTQEILEDVLELPLAKHDRANQSRVSSIMRKLGYRSQRIQRVYRWVVS